jgi:hypothetical protein
MECAPVITYFSRRIATPSFCCRLPAVLVAATGIWLCMLGADACAQATRPYQMTTHAWIDPSDAKVDIPMFSKGVFAEQPQPAGHSIAWLHPATEPEQLDRYGFDWARIVAVYVDEPYMSFVTKDRRCNAPGVATRTTKLMNLASALRARAPSTKFWVNFNEVEIDMMRSQGCSFNKSYIDVISMDFYYVDFTPALSDRYQYIYTHRPTDYQQLALVIPAFTGGTPPPGRSPQTPAEAVARMTQYLDYAAKMNQTCHLPLGRTGITGSYDGCPVWMVAGFLSGVRPPDDPALLPIDNPASKLVFDAWQSKFAIQRIDPTQPR